MSQGHVVVVGGTKGLGRVIVERYANKGFLVSVVSRNPLINSELDSAKINYISADLESLVDPTDIVKKITSFGGDIQYLIFCQRYRGEGDRWEGEIKVGLTATKSIIEALSNNFRSDSDCAILAVSSVYAEFVGDTQPVGYHAVKGGLNQLIRYYAWKLGHRGIRANGIMPLTYVKPENRARMETLTNKNSIYSKFVPLARIGDASDSANAIEFLCSENASFISGQFLYIDGGLSIVWQESIAFSIKDAV